ncbi:MAG: hypothetical protein II072_01005 [Clostridia bacterium]|nr:hypothetical protein [Clostridia bacterium]
MDALKKERLLKNAVTRERYGETNVALRIYSQVAEDYPDDYRGWYGIARLRSKNFSSTPSKKEYDVIAENMRKVLIAADTGDRNRLKKEWDGYEQSYKAFLDGKTRELSSMQSAHDEQVNRRDNVAETLKDHRDAMQSFARSHSKRGKKAKFPTVFFFVLAAGLICLLNSSRSKSFLIFGLLLVGIFAEAVVITVLVNSSRKSAAARYEAMSEEAQRLQSELDRIKANLDSSNSEIARIRYEYGL